MQKMSLKCAVYGQCGGCRYPHEDYRAYLEEQQKRLASLFSGLPLRPIVPMEDPFYYRGKIHGTFRYVNKRTVCGLYQEDSHRIVPITDCLIEDRKIAPPTSTASSSIRPAAASTRALSTPC